PIADAIPSVLVLGAQVGAPGAPLRARLCRLGQLLTGGARPGEAAEIAAVLAAADAGDEEAEGRLERAQLRGRLVTIRAARHGERRGEDHGHAGTKSKRMRHTKLHQD